MKSGTVEHQSKGGSMHGLATENTVAVTNGYGEAFGHDPCPRFLVITAPWAPEPTIATDYDDRAHALAVTERELSRRIDLGDCYDHHDKAVYYLTPAGDLLPVTYGKQERVPACDYDERSIVYAHTPILAGGCVVGHISHTDH